MIFRIGGILFSVDILVYSGFALFSSKYWLILHNNAFSMSILLAELFVYLSLKSHPIRFGDLAIIISQTWYVIKFSPWKYILEMLLWQYSLDFRVMTNNFQGIFYPRGIDILVRPWFHVVCIYMYGWVCVKTLFYIFYCVLECETNQAMTVNENVQGHIPAETILTIKKL